MSAKLAELKLKIDEMKKNIANNTPFLKIENGKTIMVKINVDTVNIIEREYKGEGQNDGKKSIRIVFEAVNLSEPNTPTVQADFSAIKYADSIYEFLKEGYNTLKITRSGLGTNTNYTILPIVQKS